jgi:hypothetical protein
MNRPTPVAACGRSPLKGATRAARQSRFCGVRLGTSAFIEIGA